MREPGGRRERPFCEYGAWIMCGVLTSTGALVGASLGSLLPSNHRDRSFVDTLANWDGVHYQHIVEHGYEYAPGEGSLVGLFPAYPAAAKGLALAFGLNATQALVAAANACCLAAFVLMGIYLRRRTLVWPASVLSPQLNSHGHDLVRSYALLAMGVLPTTFFFRMAYSESVFLCAAIGAMYAIQAGWRVPAVAFLVGLATATRPVAVALLLPLVWYVWRESRSKGQFAVRLAYALPLGCWGLLAYIVYQYCAFGEPLAFYYAQRSWRIRPDTGFSDQLLSLASWEPIWSVYKPGAPGYWNGSGVQNPLFELQFANPIYLLGTAALIAVGAWCRWLTTCEVLVSIPLLAIPYATRSYEMTMASQGRYAALVFPVYIVIGHLLARLPTVVSGAIAALSAALMAIYAALFAAGHALI